MNIGKMNIGKMNNGTYYLENFIEVIRKLNPNKYVTYVDYQHIAKDNDNNEINKKIIISDDMSLVIRKLRIICNNRNFYFESFDISENYISFIYSNNIHDAYDKWKMSIFFKQEEKEELSDLKIICENLLLSYIHESHTKGIRKYLTIARNLMTKYVEKII